MKKVLLVIIGLVAVYLVLCIVGPKVTRIERSVVINAAPEVVKTQLMDFKFFVEKWSPWTEKDPNMKSTYEGEIGKTGYKHSWEGNDSVGKGSMEFLSVTGDSINQKLMLHTWGAEGDIHLVTTPENGGSKVTWILLLKNGFIWRGMSLFMNAEKYMAPDFEKGLAKLKVAIETMPPPVAQYDVIKVEWTEKIFIGKRGTFAFDKITPFFADNWPKITEEIQKNKEQPTMQPCGIYFKWDETKGEADVAAALCAPKDLKVKGWEIFAVPTSRVFQIEYYGAYGKSMDAHMAMDKYIKENNLPAQTHVIEEYVTDPTVEKDTAKWLTNIYYVFPLDK